MYNFVLFIHFRESKSNGNVIIVMERLAEIRFWVFMLWADVDEGGKFFGACFLASCEA